MTKAKGLQIVHFLQMSKNRPILNLPFARDYPPNPIQQDIGGPTPPPNKNKRKQQK
ncbi:hypothetical protein P8H29_21260 [Pandoraea communis]|nr:hypothetical protein [Pandoraea communis]MDM8358682.1 hypothetical protein [Pandoraea communis]